MTQLIAFRCRRPDRVFVQRQMQLIEITVTGH